VLIFYTQEKRGIMQVLAMVFINNSKIKNARQNPFVVHALDSVKKGHFKTPLLLLLILW